MKQYHRYRMDFSGEWLRRSAMCMGMSILLLAVYYFGIHNLSDFGFGKLLVCLWLPLILGTAYVILLRGLKYDAPGVYALICAGFCLVYILGTFVSGSGLRVMLGIPGYLLSAAVYLIVVGGYFPSWVPASLAFCAAVSLRVLLFDVGRLQIADWIAEGSVLCSMAAFIFLPVGLKKNRA